MDHQPRSNVYLIDEKVWGDLISPGAYASLVQYSKDGIEFTVYVENDNFIERDVEE